VLRQTLRAFMLSPKHRIPVRDWRAPMLAGCDGIMRNGVRTVSGVSPNTSIRSLMRAVRMRIAKHFDFSPPHSNFIARTIPMTLNLIQARFFLALFGIVLLNSCAGFA
jgi:hypothetical protein